MSKKVLVPIADGTEEIEAVCIVDSLRRAGADVTVASVNHIQVVASRGVKLVADRLIIDCQHETYDLIALPGGMPGAEHLRDSEILTRMLKQHAANKRWLAAICASPAVILQHYGLIGEKKATCYPGFDKHFQNREAVDSRVVVDGNLISSRAPGTALEFALKLVEKLYNTQKAKEVGEKMLVFIY